jgi:hypothetical protein
MPIKKVVHRPKMAKKGTKKQALNWVPSSFDEADLKRPRRKAFYQQRRWLSFLATRELLNRRRDIG